MGGGVVEGGVNLFSSFHTLSHIFLRGGGVDGGGDGCQPGALTMLVMWVSSLISEGSAVSSMSLRSRWLPLSAAFALESNDPGRHTMTAGSGAGASEAGWTGGVAVAGSCAGGVPSGGEGEACSAWLTLWTRYPVVAARNAAFTTVFTVTRGHLPPPSVGPRRK